MSFEMYIEAIDTVAVLCTVILSLLVSITILVFCFWVVFKIAINRYVRAKRAIYTVRRWSRSEAEIVRLKKEISSLKSGGS